MKKKELAILVAALSSGTPLIANAQTASNLPAYIKPVDSTVESTSLLTAGDTAGNGYRMVGLPDGLGAYRKNSREIVALMNHELSDTLGVVRAHGGKGAFVSEWTINTKTLEVTGGEDLIKRVYLWNTAAQASEAAAATVNFSRFCSADLPEQTAFYHAKKKLGTKERIFMNGEEGGTTGYAVAHVATGKNKGSSYILGKFNPKTNGSNIDAVGGWENLLANPYSGEKTVVIGNNDGGTGIMLNSLVLYKGTKTKSGSEVDKAGLTNGETKFISVSGFCDGKGTTNEEIANTTDRTTKITSGTSFTLSTDCPTTFSRPEDGAWLSGNTYLFVTTDQLDKTELAGQTQQGGTRLWRLNFNEDWTGGTIDVLVDATKFPNGLGNQRPNMFDNMSVNRDGTISLQEDTGNAEHNAKTWLYNLRDGTMTLQTKFDPALFGDVSAAGAFTAGTHTKDEESSGATDITDILGRHDKKSYSLVVAQDHAAAADLQKIGAMNAAANPVEMVEGGQLLLLSRPTKK